MNKEAFWTKNMYLAFVSFAAAFMLAGCSVVGIRTGYEEPSYSIVDRIGDEMEIRTYAPRLAASATVDETHENAGRNQAFRILFDYISGANTGGAEIAMTVPVEVPSAGEEVAMTLPVETLANVEGRTTMRFFLPSDFTAATAPVPKDARVQIEEIPETTEAALRFTGLGSLSSQRQHRAELLRALDDSGWLVTGEPTTLFYDPPWTIPFLRRNEVVVPVARNKNFTDG